MSTLLREDGRSAFEIRPVSFELGYVDYAEGSVLISIGNTRVLCNASVMQSIPQWMQSEGREGGWITAEYAMLPRATQERTPREITRPKARSQEIRRLIGRSLRASVNLDDIQGATIIVDCDVLQADGGTRTAAITGGYVALNLALRHLIETGQADENVFKHEVAAISVGVIAGQPVVDLDYAEDSIADVDLNVVMSSEGNFIELQGTAEREPYTRNSLVAMLDLAEHAITDLITLQRDVLT